jgi:hypothetical protein
MDESLGKRLLEFTSGQYIEMDSTEKFLPEWSLASKTEKLIICEGDSSFVLDLNSGSYC